MFNELVIKVLMLKKYDQFLFLCNGFTCFIVKFYYKKLEPLITKSPLSFIVTVISTF